MKVLAVCSSSTHSFSKTPREYIRLMAGLGVEGDAHSGATVKHRSRVRADPSQPNLRQVHLLHCELFTELHELGFSLQPGDIGENITTSDVPLLSLPRGTELHIGEAAIIELTGLRNPCTQLDDFQAGLMNAVLSRDSSGKLIRKSGVMGIVLVGGVIQPGDSIQIHYPAKPHEGLERV